MLRDGHRRRFRVPSSETSGLLLYQNPQFAPDQSLFTSRLYPVPRMAHVSLSHIPNNSSPCLRPAPPSGLPISGSGTPSSWIPRQKSGNLLQWPFLPLMPHPVSLQAPSLPGSSDGGSSPPSPPAFSHPHVHVTATLLNPALTSSPAPSWGLGARAPCTFRD